MLFENLNKILIIHKIMYYLRRSIIFHCSIRVHVTAAVSEYRTEENCLL